MAINPSVEFPGKIESPTPDYPLGGAKSVTTPGASDGTPWSKVLLNDIWGFFQKAITDAGIVPSGTPDTAQDSQYFDALSQLIGVPSGSMITWPTAAIPAGFLIRDGAAISRTTYSTLFALIGVEYGIGDGITTFNIPDARGLFPRYQDLGAGVDLDVGARTDRGDGTTGDAVGTKQADAIASHSHTVGNTLDGSGTNDWDSSGSAISSGPAATTTTGGAETHPKNIYEIPLIKF